MPPSKRKTYKLNTQISPSLQNCTQVRTKESQDALAAKAVPKELGAD
jgi:hypothetical protein